MRREIVFRAMEIRLNEQAGETGEQVDRLMTQLTDQAGLRIQRKNFADCERRRQIAFVRAFAQSESQKNEARLAMQEELDQLARAVELLSAMKS